MLLKFSQDGLCTQLTPSISGNVQRHQLDAVVRRPSQAYQKAPFKKQGMALGY
jgi:hypothetical protein